MTDTFVEKIVRFCLISVGQDQ